jgi:hypothetical protein
MNKPLLFFRILMVAALMSLSVSPKALARDAAFLNPGVSSGSGVGEEAVKIDPKADIDIGETAMNVAKRATVFFVNQTSVPVKIERIDIRGDSLVMADEAANDCTKQGSIAPLSRCSVEVSVTPTGSGTWSVDVLMTHNGAGRITRARLIGRTSGSSSNEGKSTGLAISSKESKPIDFGAVDVSGGKVVRSTLMINDSADPITIYAIDVIEPDNGLQKLKQGCAVDMELAPGASCPVTLMWEPKDESPVSTDLIVRHSGKLGFAVVPVRGTTKGRGTGANDDARGEGRLPRGSVPLPLSAHDLEKEVKGRLAPVSDTSLGGGSMSGGGGDDKRSDDKRGDGKLYLIGTIGDRALFLLPNGETTAIPAGEIIEMKGGNVKLVAVNAHSADVMIGDKKKTLPLESAASLVSVAVEEARKSSSTKENRKK